MKKIINVTMLFALLITLMLSTVASAATGDIIGYAKYTDISAYINHYPISSYNINGNTAVIAEDLQNYGFNVLWNGEEHSLSITRNESADQITPYGTIYKYSSKAGQNSFPYLETNIVTYVNGAQVESFNIDGKTCLYIDSLAPYGEVVWVPEIRSIKVWLAGLPMADYTPIEEDPLSFLPANIAFYPGTTIPTYDSYTGARLSLFSSPTYAYSGNYSQSVSYREMLEKIGWTENGVDMETRQKVGSDGISRRVPYSQRYSFKKGNDYLFFTYYSQSGSVHIIP